MARGDDFQILNPPKPPIWRDPKRRAIRNSRNVVVMGASLVAAVVILLPPARGYHEPISFQIQRGEPLAWLLFWLMAVAALASLPTLLKKERWLSAILCLGVAVALIALARTDPRSSLHLSVFLYLAGAILGWTWCLWVTIQESWFLLAAALASGGAIACLASFGVGERLLISSSLLALNVLLISEE